MRAFGRRAGEGDVERWRDGETERQRDGATRIV
jgi:hypothetical protein